MADSLFHNRNCLYRTLPHDLGASGWESHVQISPGYADSPRLFALGKCKKKKKCGIKYYSCAIVNPMYIIRVCAQDVPNRLFPLYFIFANYLSDEYAFYELHYGPSCSLLCILTQCCSLDTLTKVFHTTFDTWEPSSWKVQVLNLGPCEAKQISFHWVTALP